MNFVALLVAYYFSGALDDVSGFPFIASKRAEKLNETKVWFVIRVGPMDSECNVYVKRELARPALPAFRLPMPLKHTLSRLSRAPSTMPMAGPAVILPHPRRASQSLIRIDALQACLLRTTVT
ncbi:hypothetical protein COCVIDRAFT_13893 [Bipolaris victoriae FI3]|uniref:Uncharacterized protein n=1 Tax=Bipolaris victoriae (strain FI3) TaxID=930091 RepID=W7ETT6_BIPV3|nr:hypothetical protein COCVIDRAFT_13893 [Bipolaris victoriae FI3]